MPRVGREQSGTGIYHVMLRGINRQDIFEDSKDYKSQSPDFMKLSGPPKTSPQFYRFRYEINP